MKKIWLIVAAIVIVSCKNEDPLDYAIISGQITNANSNEMSIYGISNRALVIRYI